MKDSPVCLRKSFSTLLVKCSMDGITQGLVPVAACILLHETSYSTVLRPRSLMEIATLVHSRILADDAEISPER
nr:hypothetical protein CFP56_63108 [Quercus suber]